MSNQKLKLYTYHGRYNSGAVVIAASREEAVSKIPDELSSRRDKFEIDPADLEEYELDQLTKDFEFICWADI